jgi:hypothetical protein
MKAKLKTRVDKIDTIKALLLERLEHYEKQLADIRAQLKRVEEVEAMLPSLGGVDVPGCDLTDDGQRKPKPGKPGKPYSDLSLTEALKLALVHAGPIPKTLRELRTMLANGGYVIPETKQFSTKLNATLYRLETQGLVITSEDIEGRKTFMRKI